MMDPKKWEPKTLRKLERGEVVLDPSMGLGTDPVQLDTNPGLSLRCPANAFHNHTRQGKEDLREGLSHEEDNFRE